MKIDRQKIYNKYNGHCAYCGCKLESIHDMQIDHIIPKRNGGKDEMYNFNPSCRLCNHYKRAWNLNTFKNALLAGIIDRLRKIYIFRVAEKYVMVEVHEWDQKFYFEKVEK